MSRCWTGEHIVVLFLDKPKMFHADDTPPQCSTQPDNLFRGSRVCDGKKVVIKAVHLRSREFDVIRILSSPELRKDPMNHTIRKCTIISLVYLHLARVLCLVNELLMSAVISCSRFD